MTTYAYEAVNAAGSNFRGTMDVANQSEALQRIKEMGLFPTRIAERRPARKKPNRARSRAFSRLSQISIPFPGRLVKTAVLADFTRQLATLVDAGLPLLRGLRILEQQESNRTLKRIIGQIGERIEGGSTLSEALAAHPKVFTSLYVNMVKAGEAGGALETTLLRLAEFMEKAQKIKGKVKSAMFYPTAVLSVAVIIMSIMMIFVVPRFQAVFSGLFDGKPLPAFTLFVFRVSDLIRHNALLVAAGLAVLAIVFTLIVRTKWGRWNFDYFKLKMPILGKIFLRAAISRFARTLGTLLGNGVPVLQALNIVRETTGNVVVSRVVSSIHENVKEGERMTTPLRVSAIFPPMVAGMVDVGEQTGALPDLLMKVADNYDDQVDNAVNSMTSLIEPILIVILGVIVGGIVVAVFLPIINPPGFGPTNQDGI